MYVYNVLNIVVNMSRLIHCTSLINWKNALNNKIFMQ
jgi:hypothetical protein